MKPINDKERTIAYFQFLALSILFIVVWTVAVFFDYRIKAKDYQVLKAENKILKNTMITSSDLDLQIDSFITVVKGFTKMPETEYEEMRKRFVDDIESLWLTDRKDTSELNNIKISVSRVFKEWSYSIGASIRELNKNTSIKEKDAIIQTWQNKYDNLVLQFENYKLAHP